MNCNRCGAEMADERGGSVCITCMQAIKSEMDTDLLSELSAYWDRRLMERRERDWT